MNTDKQWTIEATVSVNHPFKITHGRGQVPIAIAMFSSSSKKPVTGLVANSTANTVSFVTERRRLLRVIVFIIWEMEKPR